MRHFILLSIFCISLYSQAKAGEGLTREQIHGGMQKNTAEVFGCYKSEIKKHPELKGRIQLSFDIDSQGKVINSKISKTTLNHKPTENCVVEKSKIWIFPQPIGTQPVHVEYPFEFRRTSEHLGK